MKLYIKKYINLAFDSEKEMTDFYRGLSIEYPKFFKMDVLSKLGFLASEKMLQDEGECEETAIICFTEAASLHTDLEYQKTIQDPASSFPSPSLFVYTLPNIVTGEIAIRHGFRAETSCYISNGFNGKMINETMYRLFGDSLDLPQAIVIWINWRQTGEVNMFLVTREGENLLTEENLYAITNHKTKKNERRIDCEVEGRDYRSFES